MYPRNESFCAAVLMPRTEKANTRKDRTATAQHTTSESYQGVIIFRKKGFFSSFM